MISMLHCKKSAVWACEGLLDLNIEDISANGRQKNYTYAWKNKNNKKNFLEYFFLISHVQASDKFQLLAGTIHFSSRQIKRPKQGEILQCCIS